MEERYNLAIDRMKAIIEEKTVAEPYREYFQHVARFILKLDELKQNVESGKQKEMSEEELQEEMKDLYADELEANYEKSYANPAYAVSVLGGELGSFLSAVYTEIRGSISYVQEQRMEYVVIGAELLIEIYNKFEEEKQPQLESLKEIFYWYASDYCDVFAADRIKDQIDPERGCFIVNMIMNEDLSDLRYLYRMGEYVGVNERETAAYLNSLSQEKIDKMADTFSEGYRIGFVNTGKDLSKKSVVNIYYAMGFERIVKKAIENFAKMGLKTSIFRTSHSVITRGRNSQIGFFNISGNKQYVYDHRDDIGLVMDKQYVGLHDRSVEYQPLPDHVQGQPVGAHSRRPYAALHEKAARDGEDPRHSARRPRGVAGGGTRPVANRPQRRRRPAHDDPEARILPRRPASGQYLRDGRQRHRLHRLRDGRGAHAPRPRLPGRFRHRLRLAQQRHDFTCAGHAVR